MFSRKVIILVIVLVSPLIGYFYYRYTHPKYVPLFRPEITITIIPGWDLRDVANYFEK